MIQRYYQIDGEGYQLASYALPQPGLDLVLLDESEAPPMRPQPYTLRKSTVVRRLRDRDALIPALDLLEHLDHRELKALWDAITVVESDDPETPVLRQMLDTIDGLDVDAILAPEA